MGGQYGSLDTERGSIVTRDTSSSERAQHAFVSYVAHAMNLPMYGTGYTDRYPYFHGEIVQHRVHQMVIVRLRAG